jgi:hypothetical protein
MGLLPSDCVKRILDYVDLAHVADACLGLSTRQDIRHLITHRRSPIRLLSSLVQNPQELLIHMMKNKCLLSGSRVTDYFSPGSCTAESDWDFYVKSVPEDNDQVFGTMRQALGSMGVKWDNVLDTNYDSLMIAQVLKGTIARGNGRSHKVQVIYSDNRKLMNCILLFHSSPVQCFMTHSGAFHMYGKVTSRSQQIVWHKNIKYSGDKIQERNVSVCPVDSRIDRLSREYLDDLEKLSLAIGTVELLRTRYLAEQHEMNTESAYGNSFRNFARLKLSTMNEVGTEVQMIIEDEFNDLCAITRNKCICIKDVAYDKVSKYTRRGFEVLPFTLHQKSSQGWVDEKRVRVRRIGDPDTTVVKFRDHQNPYIDTILKEDTMRVQQFRWFEYEDGVMPLECKTTLGDILHTPYRDLTQCIEALRLGSVL